MNSEENKYKEWNVALAGVKDDSNKWGVPGAETGKIERSVKAGDTKCLSIGSLRSGEDVLCDVDYQMLTAEQRSVCDWAIKSKKNAISVRNDLGLKDVPLLLIYCIDKHGGQDSPAGRKLRMNSKEDIIGFSIIIPGEPDGSTHAKSVTVTIPD